MPIDKEIPDKRKRECTKLCELSEDVIRETFDKFKPEEIGITWTGGKNSNKSAEIPTWGQDLSSTEERAGRRQDKEQAMFRLRMLGYR